MTEEEETFASAEAMTNALYDALKQTATAHIKAFESPKPWDAEAVLALRTPDCLHTLHPTDALPEAFRSANDNAHIGGFLGMFGAIIERFEFDIKAMAVDVQQRSEYFEPREMYSNMNKRRASDLRTLY